MLARSPAILAEARATGRALAGFSTYTLESTLAICAAAEQINTPVIIQVSAGAFAVSSRETLSALVLAAASECGVPVGVHLDHSRDLEEIRACIALGYTSVMVDGSHLDFAENVALTRTVVDEAHAAGVWVEAELGAIAGSEHRSDAADASARTDPAAAAAFVAATGVDLLAGAVGTVHGMSSARIVLDGERIEAIVAATGIAFALHGASGLSDRDLRRAIDAGATKVNINTELRRAYFAGLTGALERGGDDVTRVQLALIEAMTAVAAERLAVLSQPSTQKRLTST